MCFQIINFLFSFNINRFNFSELFLNLIRSSSKLLCIARVAMRIDLRARLKIPGCRRSSSASSAFHCGREKCKNTKDTMLRGRENREMDKGSFFCGAAQTGFQEIVEIE